MKNVNDQMQQLVNAKDDDAEDGVDMNNNDSTEQKDLTENIEVKDI